MPRKSTKKAADSTNVLPKTSEVINKTATAPRKRGWDSAKFQSTLGMMPFMSIDFNDEFRRDINALRARSRDASLNDPYLRRYFKSLVSNVVGPNGIQLKMAVNNPNGTPDTTANQLIESRYKDFCRKVSVDGKSMREFCKLYLETVARDGECFVRILRGREFGKYNLTLALYEAEHCDVNHNAITENGRSEIRSGIQYDEYGRVEGYWLWRYNPNSIHRRTIGNNERIFIPADEIIHGYNKERQTQGRGFPWTAAALLPLKHILEFTRSELIASRVASAKMGFFVRKNATDEAIGDYEDPADPNAFIQEASPGMFDVLPVNWELQTFDPQNPNTSFGDFVKKILEATAASLGIGYSTLSGDVSSANYSSLRQAAIEERETFREHQQWMIETLLTPVFEAFLTNLLAFQLEGVRLPLSKFGYFNQPVWRPRVWAWVDPAKETSAIVAQLEQNLRSRTDVARSFGMEYTDVLNEIAAEQALAKQLGVQIEPSGEKVVEKLTQPTTDDDDNEDQNKPNTGED